VDPEEETDGEIVSTNTFGLRQKCPLNKLEAFHSVLAFPPDAMHDLFEGCIAQDLYGIIKIFILKGWFNVEQYNKRLRYLGYHSHEASDKPQDVPVKLKGLKLPGKAVSQWVHLRNFPLIMKSFVQDPEDEVLSFALKLVDVTNRITANEFKTYEIQILEETVLDYLDTRQELMETYSCELGTPKPKHHFLTHYGQAIRLFGPPLCYWTARFESKHRISKNTAESAKNFKNISLTVSVRQQMRMASIYYRGMFETKKFTLPEKVKYKNDLQPASAMWIEIKEVMGASDLVCTEIIASHQKYKKGDLVVTEVVDGGEKLKVGLIEVILVRNSEVSLVLRNFVAAKQFLGYYESETNETGYTFTEIKLLADYKPLVMRGTVSKFQFVIHHHISN
jgi:hypothetical protein